MAEGFARAYGADVIHPLSAGLSPAVWVEPLTRQVMLEKNIDIGDAFPKSVDIAVRSGVDLIVNMSGHKLPARNSMPVEDWDVLDPIGRSEEVYREVRDQIEQRVMRLILEMRKRDAAPVDTPRRAPRQ